MVVVVTAAVEFVSTALFCGVPSMFDSSKVKVPFHNLMEQTCESMCRNRISLDAAGRVGSTLHFPVRKSRERRLE
jgi:hypothetical protein